MPPTLTAVSGVARYEAGAASGLLNATRQAGGSLDLSILITVLDTVSAVGPACGSRGHRQGRTNMPGRSRRRGRAPSPP
ncbi:hypothetical protein ACIGXX_37630 [Streptomyces sp. NPDC055243]|uniref:hypothetical protein n=1 Tax=Streptomyces sp. NPDC055243 TaxID=3365720 RepID=UPI0037D764AD